MPDFKEATGGWVNRVRDPLHTDHTVDGNAHKDEV
jgi:hypothetical protein